MPPAPPRVPFELYSHDYYESVCEGFEEFSRSRGRELPARIAAAIAKLTLPDGASILDLGCGRGEAAAELARRGGSVTALDSSIPALTIARAVERDRVGSARVAAVRFLCADARSLPLEDTTFDAVFALDFVEHLDAGELADALAEIRRVLVPGGSLVVHTMPNLWYYRFGYPLFRAFERLRGKSVPRDPRERWPLLREMHVGEQSPATLRRVLSAAGFEARVWLESTGGHGRESNRLVRAAMNVLVRAPILRAIFCDEIFAIARKSD